MISLFKSRPRRAFGLPEICSVAFLSGPAIFAAHNHAGRGHLFNDFYLIICKRSGRGGSVRPDQDEVHVSSRRVLDAYPTYWGSFCSHGCC